MISRLWNHKFQRKTATTLSENGLPKIVKKSRKPRICLKLEVRGHFNKIKPSTGQRPFWPVTGLCTNCIYLHDGETDRILGSPSCASGDNCWWLPAIATGSARGKQVGEQNVLAVWYASDRSVLSGLGVSDGKLVGAAVETKFKCVVTLDNDRILEVVLLSAGMSAITTVAVPAEFCAISAITSSFTWIWFSCYMCIHVHVTDDTQQSILDILYRLARLKRQLRAAGPLQMSTATSFQNGCLLLFPVIVILESFTIQLPPSRPSYMVVTWVENPRHGFAVRKCTRLSFTFYYDTLLKRNREGRTNQDKVRQSIGTDHLAAALLWTLSISEVLAWS